MTRSFPTGLPSRLQSPFRATALALVVISTTAAGAQPAGPPEPPPDHRSEPRSDDRAALRSERVLAQALARLDDELGLGSSPDATPLWSARLAASIESRSEIEPAQALLRNLAVELRGLGVGWTLGGRSDERPDGRPAAASPPGRERAERIQRIRRLVELVSRKLRLAGMQDDATGRITHSRSGPVSSEGSSLVRKYGSDSCTSASVLSLGYTDGDTYGDTNDGASSCGGPTPSPDVWYVFTAPQDGVYTFRTVDPSYYHYQSFDTVLSLHSACPVEGGDLFELACSDDVGSTLLSSITHPLSAGQTVRVRVSGYGGAYGDYELLATLDRTIRGTVTRSDTGAAVSGATVEILDRYGYLVTEATSEPDGTYAAGVAASPELYARVRDGRYVTEYYDDLECPFGTYCSTYSADPISVTDGDASGVDFTLRPGASISGSITTADTGEPPAAGTYIETYDATGGNLGSYSYDEGDGSYRILSLLPGTYYLRATTGGYQEEVWNDVACPYPCDPTRGDPVVVGEGTELTGVDFVLDRLGRVEGVVTRDGTGEPVEYGLVVVYGEDGGYGRSDYTASNGVYEIDGLSEGTYFVRTDTTDYLDELYDDLSCEPDCDVTTGTAVPVSVNAEVSGIDFSLVTKASVSGRVTDAATGEFPEVYVYLYDAAGTLVQSRRADVYTEGRFQFRGLEAGTHYLRAGYAYQSSWATHEGELYDAIPCEPDCDVTSGTPVVTTATSQVTGIDFALDRRGWIAGTLTDATTGNPLTWAYVYAFELDGTYFEEGYVQPDGTYEILNLPSGSYRVGTAGDLYRDEMFDDVACGDPCDRTTGSPVVVQSSTETANIDFALTPFGRIAGTVVDASNGEAIDADLFLLDATGRVIQSEGPYNSSYVLVGIRPGTYYLKAREDDFYENPFQDELFPNVPCEPDCDLSEATAITIGLGTSLTGYDFSLAPCPADSRQEVSSATLTGYQKVLACERITADHVTVAPGADALFRSGRSIVLGDGFLVAEGARFRAVIEPAWSAED